MDGNTDNSVTIAVRVEIPKGSRNKYEVDPETGDITLDRRLHAAVAYPTEYGYVPRTLVGDGDELDAMVVITEPTFPGCLVPARPIAVLRMRRDSARNDKLLCVPVADPAWNDITDLTQLPTDLREEVEHFFRSYTALEDSDWQIEGWEGVDAACELLARARRAYDDHHHAQ